PAALLHYNETIMAFAGRVKAHAAQCPTSDFAQRVCAWDQTRTDYAKLFGKPLPAHALARLWQLSRGEAPDARPSPGWRPPAGSRTWSAAHDRTASRSY